MRIDHSDGVLVDPREPIRLRHAAYTEDRQRGEEQYGGARESQRDAVALRGRRRRRGHWHRRRGGDVERRVLGQDPRLETTQLGSGLDADSLHQRRAGLPVGLKCLRLPAGAIQRQHPPPVQLLAQRMLGHQPVELTEHLLVKSSRQIGVDRLLGRAQAPLPQPTNLRGGERFFGDVGERLATPQRERLAGTRLFEQALEPDRVDLAAGQPQLVTAPTGHDNRTVALEQPAQVRDMLLDHLGCAWRRLIAPQALRQALRRDRMAHPQREHRQDGSLLTRTELDWPAVEARLDRP